MSSLKKIKLVMASMLAFVAGATHAATVEMQKAMRINTFEVVLKKPEKDPLSYEKPLPLELLPYMERTDQYRSIGTAFSLGHNTYVTAGHVLSLGINSQFGVPALRNADGKVFAIDQIIKYSIHEDFAVFTVSGDPAPQGLTLNTSPQVNNAVYAVGNALGEGVVIRDGLYTSDTPEEQDGRWKWIRFSAPASPGNSGGPLVDANGAVIGIVIGKSANENLNYSLPINRVLDAPVNKALFDTRYLEGLPYMHDTMTHKLKTEFSLPKNWESFATTFMHINDQDVKQAQQELLSKYADKYFPVGGDEVLYDLDQKYDPQLIMQYADEHWGSVVVRFNSTDLPVDGFFKIGAANNVSLFRLHRPSNLADATFYHDSKAFMDMALKGMNIERQVGTDQVHVTSLGIAKRDEKITDNFGRVWQQRVWAVPYLDVYVVAMMLPTPDGYVGIMTYAPSSTLNSSVFNMVKVAEVINVGYWGTVEQWQVFLKQRELLPRSLARFQLDFQETNQLLKLSTDRIAADIDSKLVKTTSKSLLGINMNYEKIDGKLEWSISCVGVTENSQRRAYVSLKRHLRPVEALKREYHDEWQNLVQHKAPFDSDTTRETTESWSAATPLRVDSIIAGKKSNSLLYELKIAVENYIPDSAMADKLKAAERSIKIIEHGDGDLNDERQSTTPSTNIVNNQEDDTDSLRQSFNKGKQIILNAANIQSRNSFDSTRDLRGRTFADDMREDLISEEIRASLSQAESTFDKAVAAHDEDVARIQIDSLPGIGKLVWDRYQLISGYWSDIRKLETEKALWVQSLTNNHLPLDTPHGQKVVEAQAELDALATPSVAFNTAQAKTLDKLVTAMLLDRNRIIRSAGGGIKMESKYFQSRETACPAGTGGSLAGSGDVERALAFNATAKEKVVRARIRGSVPDIEEYYPADSKRDGEEGVVVVAMYIDLTGCPKEVAVAGSSGSTALDKAALKFVELIPYYPATIEGRPIDSVQTLVINFKLSESRRGSQH